MNAHKSIKQQATTNKSNNNKHASTLSIERIIVDSFPLCPFGVEHSSVKEGQQYDHEEEGHWDDGGTKSNVPLGDIASG